MTQLVKIKERGYRVTSTLSLEETQVLFNHLIDSNYVTTHVFKDIDRNLVIKLNAGNFKSLVYKVPRRRNNNFFERFRSSYKKSYAKHTFDSNIKLQQLGFNSPNSVLVAEKKVFGFVVDSFIVTRFIESYEESKDHFELIVSEMVKLASLGYTRSDPNLDNFLYSDNKIYFIDFKLRKDILFPKIISKMQLVYLENRFPKAFDYYPKDNSFQKLYKVAKIINHLKFSVKHYKNKIKGIFGINSN